MMELKEILSAVAERFEAFTKDAEAQVEKKNKAAGARARKSALEISKLMKEFRKASMDSSKA